MCQRTFRSSAGGNSGMSFVPCVVEVPGRLGDELRRFINMLGTFVAENGGCKRTFVRYQYEAISCAVARGNTRMYSMGLHARLRGTGSDFRPAYNACISGHCDE